MDADETVHEFRASFRLKSIISYLDCIMVADACLLNVEQIEPFCNVLEGQAPILGGIHCALSMWTT